MPVRRRTTLVASLALLAALTACTAPAAERPEEAAAFVLTSSDVDADGYLPDSARGNVEEYCGDGDNVSPNLAWTGVPDGTKSFLLTMTDPNYASYIHWVVTGIPGETTELAAAPDGLVSVGVVGANSRGEGDYVGPCQPDNGYLYTLYALDEVIEGTSSTTLSQAVALMTDHVLGQAEIEAKRH